MLADIACTNAWCQTHLLPLKAALAHCAEHKHMQFGGTVGLVTPWNHHSCIVDPSYLVSAEAGAAVNLSAAAAWHNDPHTSLLGYCCKATSHLDLT